MVHALAVAKAEIQKRRIRLIKATGMVGEGLSALMEKQLVEKANLALALMETDMERKPGVVKFIGARKDRGIGGVTYELNSTEAMDWIKGKTVMSAFLVNMGSMTDYKEQTYKVVMDWVPVTLNVNQPRIRHAIKQASRLKEASIKEIAWIKPTHLCGEGQKTMRSPSSKWRLEKMLTR